jgi:hypothetical protein
MSFKKVIAAAVLAVSLSACQSTVLQKTYSDQIAYNLEQHQVEQAILEAGATRGWMMTPVKPGEINAVLNIRAHKVVTSITYDAKTFSVNYVDSVNLNAKNGKIHRQYVNWVTNLRQDIQIRLNAASLKNMTK